jgi:hypothetical protein
MRPRQGACAKDSPTRQERRNQSTNSARTKKRDDQPATEARPGFVCKICYNTRLTLGLDRLTASGHAVFFAFWAYRCPCQRLKTQAGETLQ